MKEFKEYRSALGYNETEELLLLGIEKFPFFRKKKKSMKIDEDEYNDDFNEETESIDEEPGYEDDDSDMISYIHDNDEAERYDLSELKDFPLLRAVLKYNNNRRIYYA